MHTTILKSTWFSLFILGCSQHHTESAGIKDVTAHGDDYQTQVPAEDIYLRGEIAAPLIANLKFDRVNQEPNNIERSWLELGENATLSCHRNRAQNSKEKSWEVGCHIAIFKGSTDVSSMPCDDQCQEENLMFAASGLSGADHYQKVSLVGFDRADAEKLYAALQVPEKILQSGIPGFFNDIPGKSISNLPPFDGSPADAGRTIPKQVFSLLCGKKTIGKATETRCMLFAARGE